MSTTFDDAPQSDARPWRIDWRQAAIAATLVGCIGFAAGFGAARLRPLISPAVALAAPAGAAMLVQHVERIADVERSFAAYRGRLEESDALLRAAGGLRDALRAGGPYSAPLAMVLAQRDAAQALAPLREELLLRADGAPDRVALGLQLDALAMSLLALDEVAPQGWTGRMMQRVAVMLPIESRASRHARRERAFDAARDAASRGALDQAIAALAPLDAEAAAVLADWIEEARQRIALEHLADRVAALVLDHAYH